MIVKYTFNNTFDNTFRYTDIIKKYLEDGGITVTDYYADDSDLADQTWEEMRALRYIYDLYNKNYFTEKSLSKETFNKIVDRICFLLKDNIVRYLRLASENIDWNTKNIRLDFSLKDITSDELAKNIETIINDLNISLVHYIPDTTEYTGNIYYLPDLENYIAM